MSAQAVAPCGRDLSTMAAARKRRRLDTVFMYEPPSHDTSDQQSDKDDYDDTMDPSRKCCRRRLLSLWSSLSCMRMPIIFILSLTKMFPCSSVPTVQLCIALKTSRTTHTYCRLARRKEIEINIVDIDKRAPVGTVH